MNIKGVSFVGALFSIQRSMHGSNNNIYNHSFNIGYGLEKQGAEGMIYKLAWWVVTKYFRGNKNVEVVSHKVKNEDFILIRADYYFQLRKKGRP